MTGPVPDDAETLALIYEAALEPARWEDVLLRIGERTGSQGGQILLWDATAGVAFSRMAGGGGDDPSEAERLFAEYYGSIDPRREYAMSLPVGQWMACHQVCDEAFVARSEFYQDYFLPVIDARYMAGARLADANGLHAMIAIARRRSSTVKPFEDDALRRLALLSPHLQRAARLQLRIARLQRALDGRNQALDQLALPLLLVERDGTLRFANLAAEERLKRPAAPLGYLRGRLVARTGADSSALAASLERAVVGRSGSSVALGEGLRRWSCTVVPLGPRSAFQGSPQRPMALVVLNDGESTGSASPAVLAAVFGLTPAESRLALAIAAGDSIADCADRFQVTAATLRAQLRAIFLKLGVHRQAEMVSLLQRMASGVRQDSV